MNGCEEVGQAQGFAERAMSALMVLAIVQASNRASDLVQAGGNFAALVLPAIGTSEAIVEHMKRPH